MGLIDKLRNAEEQGRATTHRRLEKAREYWEDAERRLRRKMRLHPKSENAPHLAREASPPVSSSASVGNATLSNRASEEDAA